MVEDEECKKVAKGSGITKKMLYLWRFSLASEKGNCHTMLNLNL